MNNSIIIEQSLVSIDWLTKNFSASNLIVLDATMKKANENSSISNLHEGQQIRNACFIDIAKEFSDPSSELPNTLLSAKEFTKSARKLGINDDSAIIVYDDLGIYSGPRVWWMFKAMGHDNIAVLDGGFPAWKNAGLPCENKKECIKEMGNFNAVYNQDFFCNYQDIAATIHNDCISVVDARSKRRFNGLDPEPREGLRKGHIPNSLNIPYTELLQGGKMKTKEDLSDMFSEVTDKDEKLIFSCGSGVTACILVLGASLAGLKNVSVYDGSWTEWGSR